MDALNLAEKDDLLLSASPNSLETVTNYTEVIIELELNQPIILNDSAGPFYIPNGNLVLRTEYLNTITYDLMSQLIEVVELLIILIIFYIIFDNMP